ncbi:hypothetical protein JCM6882_008338 [Rhodosporidiobolus microsporus]
MSDHEYSPDLGVGTSSGGGGGREERDETLRKMQDLGKKSLFNDDPSMWDDDDLDVKPLLSQGPFGAGGYKAKQEHLGVIDLCDQSDGETPPPSSSSKGLSQAVLAGIRTVVPDVHPVYLLKLAKMERHGGNPDSVVNELLASNYPLKQGGWRFGEPEGVKQRKAKKRASDDDDDDEEEEEQEVEDSDEERERRKKSAAKGKGKGKEKAGAGKQKGKKRVEPSDDEDEEEVDQLASDQEDEEEEQNLPMLSKKEAYDLKDFYLDADGRKPGGDDYRVAALHQLLRDYDKFAKSHIKQIFESDQCLELYAPTWVELLNLMKRGTLNKLKGERDLDKPIRGADGKEHARPEVPKSRMLEKEINWLESYMHHKGKFENDNPGKAYKPAASPKSKKKVKPADKADPPRPKKKQAATRDELKNGWRGEKQPKKKAKRLDFGYEDDGQSDDWWDNEGGGEPLSGLGRRLGD